jgi:acetyl/propionyl-CoA carboxylase alpha subunit
MRQEMSNCALEIARLLKYESAGTVEFIVVSTVRL